jgi:hypothetical protein
VSGTGAPEEHPNRVLPTLLVRDLLPFLPVWLFGVVLAVTLDSSGLVGPRLPLGDIDHFAGYYSLLVAAMGSVNLLRHYRSAPRGISVSADGVGLTFSGARGDVGPELLPFERVHAVYLSGFFGPHLESVGAGAGTRSMPLTAENARSVASAWTRWRETRPNEPE